MSSATTETLITFILGGGAIALVTQIIRATRLWRTGRLATTREVIKDIAAARDEAEEREDEQRADALFWSSVAAAYLFQLRRAGIQPDPPNPVPPSEKKRRQRRSERARRAPTTQEIERVIGEEPEE